MHSLSPHALAVALVLALVPQRPAVAQDPPAKPPPDEFRALLKEVEEAYKAPLEVDKDVLDELRKQYRDPKPEREAKIFREIRRLYVTTPAQEEAIARELRRAYQQPSPEQEARVFQEIRRGGQLSPGTVPADVQVERAAKTFRKFDRNGDGILSSDEMPEFLRGQVREVGRQWRRVDRPGRVPGLFPGEPELGVGEGGLRRDSDQGAEGGNPRGPAVPTSKAVTPVPPARSPAGPAPAKPPEWFARLDEDGDGQVGLYEWKRAGRPIAEFLAMDRNHDGFLEVKELLAYLAEHSASESRGKKGR